MAKFTERFQIELGVNWRLFPSGGITWSKWAWDPYGDVIWPGKEIQLKDMLEGTLGPGWTRMVDEEERDPATNLRRTHWFARYYRIGLALQILGIDLGFGFLYRPRNEIDEQAEKAV
jgi:hypothetical protein